MTGERERLPRLTLLANVTGLHIARALRADGRFCENRMDARDHGIVGTVDDDDGVIRKSIRALAQHQFEAEPIRHQKSIELVDAMGLQHPPLYQLGG